MSGRSRTSAGILLFRRAPDGHGIEVLLAYPGGPFFARKDAGHWTIPKGEVGPGEELVEVARREFLEETGQALPSGPLLELGSIVQKGGKIVHAWAVEGDVDPAVVSSNTFTMEWPPGSGRQREFPEIDRVAWFQPTDARGRIKAAQAPLIDRLEMTLGQEAAASPTRGSRKDA